jgi:hypothetical protein
MRDGALIAPVGPNGLPRRKGTKPRTFRGPLHIQCNGYGDPKYLSQLVEKVLTWPQIESLDSVVNRRRAISIRVKQIAAVTDPSAFITGREFARVLLKAPTIYLALPFEAAHWAVFRGWAEPHYLRSYGLMPVSVFVVYTPRDKEELEVCSILFSEFCLPPCWFRIERSRMVGVALTVVSVDTPSISSNPSGFALPGRKRDMTRSSRNKILVFPIATHGVSILDSVL